MKRCVFHVFIKFVSLSYSRIHTIPSVPIVDCFQKIRQQVKCYLQMASTMGKQELQEVRDKQGKILGRRNHWDDAGIMAHFE